MQINNSNIDFKDNIHNSSNNFNNNISLTNSRLISMREYNKWILYKDNSFFLCKMHNRCSSSHCIWINQQEHTNKSCKINNRYILGVREDKGHFLLLVMLNQINSVRVWKARTCVEPKVLLNHNLQWTYLLIQI
jgi:hypothetical protein